ncbi:nucleotide exchange factor GrpE [bacterium]|nr:nucleotide exchange factor GrpE [bacterium]
MQKANAKNMSKEPDTNQSEDAETIIDAETSPIDADEIEVEIKDGKAKDAKNKKTEADERTPEELKQAGEYMLQLQQLQAEFQNYKRRTAKQQEDLGVYTKADLLRKILPFLDDLDRFVDSHQEDPVMEGFKLIHNKLMAILKEEGMQRVAAEGEVFDPNMHEALHVQEVTEEGDDGKVLAEWEKGYFFKQTLLRPSKVQVGKLKSE